MIDYPSKRSNHINPTPKGIGIILTPLILISTLIILYFENSQNINLFNWVMISFMLLFGLVSFWMMQKISLQELDFFHSLRL